MTPKEKDEMIADFLKGVLIGGASVVVIVLFFIMLWLII